MFLNTSKSKMMVFKKKEKEKKTYFGLEEKKVEILRCTFEYL